MHRIVNQSIPKNSGSLVICGVVSQTLRRHTQPQQSCGKICVDVSSHYWAVIREYDRDTETALKLIRSEMDHACEAHGFDRVFSPGELEQGTIGYRDGK